LWGLTLVDFNPTALGDSHHQPPEQGTVPLVRLLFVCRLAGTPDYDNADGHALLLAQTQRGGGFLRAKRIKELI
jgi:hypothetical protein